MKRLLKISVWLLLYCLLTAKSCSGPEDDEAVNQARIVTARDSIRAAMAFDSLPEISQRAFEGSAKQKLYDLSDYMQIYADTSLGGAFRKKAEEMICRLFIDHKLPTNYNANESPVFDSVKVSRPLERTSDSSYSGQLSCFSLSQPKCPGMKNTSFPRVFSIDIHVVKRSGICGNDTINTWKVFLGKIH